MVERCGFEEVLRECGLPEQGSNRGYRPWQLIMGLFAGVWCGASKFGHLDLVRYDRVLSKMIGWNIGAGHRAYQRYLNKFTQATNQKVFGRLYHWFFSQLVFDNYTLDFDSTVMVREGEQEGAAKGYNPKRPGRNSHHPILAFVSDIRMKRQTHPLSCPIPENTLRIPRHLELSRPLFSTLPYLMTDLGLIKLFLGGCSR